MAAKLVTVCAFLHHEKIPDFLLEEIGKEEDFNPEKKEVSEALTLLGNFSLISRDLESRACSIHVLVQEIVQENLSEVEIIYYANYVYEILIKIYPDFEGYNKLEYLLRKHFLLPHLETLRQWVKGDENKLLEIIDRMQDACRYVDYPKSEKLLSELLLILRKGHHREEYYRIGKVYQELGVVYRNLGREKKSRIYINKAIYYFKKRSNVSVDDPTIAKAKCKLSDAYNNLGKAEKAESVLLKAIPLLKKTYGKDHYEVALAQMYLRNTYSNLGKAEESKNLLIRALSIQENYYDKKDHPQIGYTLNYLGLAHTQLGDTEEAKEFFKRALGIFKQVGKNFHMVGILLNNLACIYGQSGDVKGKKELLEEACNILEGYYGKDHYEVARVLHNLGNVYVVLGNVQKGKGLLEEALSIKEKHYKEKEGNVCFKFVSDQMNKINAIDT